MILFNIEANLHNKHLVKLTIKTSEDIEALAPEQYGSRKEKSADIQALNTRLFHDLTTLKWKPSTSTFADIVSNYYFVFHSITYLSMQHANTPKELIMCKITTLQNMEHSVRTALGESETTYGEEK